MRTYTKWGLGTRVHVINIHSTIISQQEEAPIQHSKHRTGWFRSFFQTANTTSLANNSTDATQPMQSKPTSIDMWKQVLTSTTDAQPAQYTASPVHSQPSTQPPQQPARPVLSQPSTQHPRYRATYVPSKPCTQPPQHTTSTVHSQHCTQPDSYPASPVNSHPSTQPPSYPA